MIRTVADLLTKLLEVERERLDAMKLPRLTRWVDNDVDARKAATNGYDNTNEGV